jgi:hypothetical protein
LDGTYLVTFLSENSSVVTQKQSLGQGKMENTNQISFLALIPKKVQIAVEYPGV